MQALQGARISRVVPQNSDSLQPWHSRGVADQNDDLAAALRDTGRASGKGDGSLHITISAPPGMTAAAQHSNDGEEKWQQRGPTHSLLREKLSCLISITVAFGTHPSAAYRPRGLTAFIN
jgi:hypothetical protein